MAIVALGATFVVNQTFSCCGGSERTRWHNGVTQLQKTSDPGSVKGRDVFREEDDPTGEFIVLPDIPQSVPVSMDPCIVIPTDTCVTPLGAGKTDTFPLEHGKASWVFDKTKQTIWLHRYTLEINRGFMYDSTTRCYHHVNERGMPTRLSYNGNIYESLVLAGEGASGQVMRYTNPNHKSIIVKGVPLIHELCLEREFLEGTDRGNVETISNEARYLNMVSHENVVKLLGVINFCGNKYLVLEDGGADIRDLTYDTTPQTKAVVQVHERQSMQIWRGLAAIHESGCFHNDLTPENILYDGHTFRISDMGIAELQVNDKMTYGSALTIPLELMREMYNIFPFLKRISRSTAVRFPSTKALDLWGFGVILFHMRTAGKYPFGDSEARIGKRAIRGGKELESPHDVQDFAKQVQSIEHVEGVVKLSKDRPPTFLIDVLIYGCLRMKPEDRFTPDQISKIVDTIDRMVVEAET